MIWLGHKGRHVHVCTTMFDYKFATHATLAVSTERESPSTSNKLSVRLLLVLVALLLIKLHIGTSEYLAICFP